MITTKLLAHSVNPRGEELWSLLMTYPRFIHSELMTYRLFGRNAASSRAIPTATFRERVLADPALPVRVGKNQPGMAAAVDVDPATAVAFATDWCNASVLMCNFHAKWEKEGIHKQLLNRVLEPWQWMTCLVTTAKPGLDNFLMQRLDHGTAQPEIVALAFATLRAVAPSTPVQMEEGGIHSPFMCDEVRSMLLATATLEDGLMILAGRSARLSYMTFDRKRDLSEDLTLGRRLAAAPHPSPFEHTAIACDAGECTPRGNKSGNLQCYGWVQHRKLIENECLVVPGTYAALLKERTNV